MNWGWQTPVLCYDGVGPVGRAVYGSANARLRWAPSRSSEEQAMHFGFFDPVYLLFVAPALLLALSAQRG